MNLTAQQLSRFATILGLGGVAITEALRPGTIGAAVNLGVVLLIAVGILVISRKP